MYFEGEESKEPESKEPESKEPESKEPETKKEKKQKGPTFTQDQQAYVNSLVAEEKRKGQSATEQLITQLETQKNLASTSKAERETLESRIESLRSEYSTKEELQRKDSEKKLKDERIAREKAEKEATSWRERFVEDRIRTAIISSAAENKAYDPEQIYDTLRSKTRLIDILGEDNKPTGEYVARSKIEGKGKDGPTQLDLTVAEAVKTMTEMPEKYGNLFNSNGVGGLGGMNSSSRGKVSTGPPDDPEGYIAWRKKKGHTSVNSG